MRRYHCRRCRAHAKLPERLVLVGLGVILGALAANLEVQIR